MHMHFLLLSLLPLITPISLQLPPLIKYQTKSLLPPINLTLNIPFTLPLPSFDPPLNLSHLSSQFSCGIEPPTITVQSLHSLPLDYDPTFSKKYFLATDSLLYLLDIPTASLHAYTFANEQLQFLTTHQFEFSLSDNESSPCLLLNDSTLYVFSSSAIWVIPTHTVLTQVHTYAALPLTKVVVVGDAFVGINNMQSIVFIKKNQTSFYISREIKEYAGEFITPVGVVLGGDYLYVVDYYKGVYVYEVKGVREAGVLDVEIRGKRKFIAVVNGSVFLGVQHSTGSTVMEMEYKEGVYYFVRYYKEQEHINWMQPLVMAGQKVLLYITNEEQIHFYSFGQDPRILTHTHNGGRMQMQGVRKLFHIRNEEFIMVTGQQIMYVRVLLRKAAVRCEGKDSAGVYNVSIVVNSSCGTTFNQYCQVHMVQEVRVRDPEGAQLQKDLLMLGIAAVVALFFAGIICLVEWRHQKMVVLSRLKDQIIRYRNTHKRLQPFNQEVVEGRSIELEMPE